MNGDKGRSKSVPKIRNVCREAKSDCTAYYNGRCVALQDTDFKRPCPFFKSRLRTVKPEMKERSGRR